MALDVKDMLNPIGAIGSLVGGAALGFAAGYMMARDPTLVRRVLSVAAHGLERVQVALAETREELADSWAEARERARSDMEAESFGPSASNDEVVEAVVGVEVTAPPRRRGAKRAAKKSTKRASVH